MPPIPDTKPPRRMLRRWVMAVASLAVLVAVFYAEEDWRGQRAWKNCQHEFEAKGMVMDWNKYIPPLVPDDQNFFAAPKMQEWFVKPNGMNSGSVDLPRRLQSTNQNLTGSVGSKTNLITTVAAAQNYLAWSDQFQPDFDLIRQALKRPYARMAGDYTHPDEMPIPNFVTVRIVAQMLSQRTHCYLLLNQPEQALKEITLVHDMCRLLEAAPTGKPMTLVSAMINVAVTGLYADVIAEGLRSGKWQESQLIALQKQLAEINLAPFMAGAFENEPLGALQYFETVEPRKLFALSSVVTGSHQKPSLWDRVRNLDTRLWDLLPRGWIYQNMASYLKLSEAIRTSLLDADGFVTPKKCDRVMREVETKLDHPNVFNLFSAIAIPNYSKAMQTFAFNQTKANEAQIVCALERYKIANGNYPETLDALVPQFIEKIPPDLIGGQPLDYRRKEDGKFLLYSIGWNETDDAGLPGTLADVKKGDWVWP